MSMLINRGEHGLKLPPSEVEYRYFQWLCKRGGFSNGFSSIPVSGPGACYTHFNLAQLLHDIPFVFTVPNDDNRVADVKQRLRPFFANFESDFSDYTCIDIRDVSVLEVLIAFAERIDTDLMMGIEDEHVDRSGYWLWVMLDNLGISMYDDDSWNLDAYQDARQKVNIFLNRDYDSLGRGGLFPLENSKKDQRTVELWYQMQEYFIANWDGLNTVFKKKNDE